MSPATAAATVLPSSSSKKKTLLPPPPATDATVQPKISRRHGRDGVRLVNAAFNIVVLVVCSYLLLDFTYPTHPSRLSRLLSSVGLGPADNHNYAGVALNTQLAYAAAALSRAPVANCTALLSSLGKFDAVRRIAESSLSSAHFQSSWVQGGRPLLVTGVGSTWPISNMSLAQLRTHIGAAPLTKRAARSTAGPLRQLTLFDWLSASAAARHPRPPPHQRQRPTAASNSSTRTALASDYYFSHTNAVHDASLLAAGLYSTPAFLGEQPWLGEWVYVGGLGTGVTPHIDQPCA